MVHQAGFVEHQVNDLAQGHALSLLTQHIDHGHKSGQIGPGLAGGGAHRIVQRTTCRTGCVLQLLDAAGPNATRRKVDHPQKTGVVVGVLHQAQIGQRVLDLGTFKKAQTAIHPVRKTGIEQRGFQHPALRVAAVQQGHFLALKTVLFDQLAQLFHQPLRLGKVRRRLHHAHRLTRALGRAQGFAQPGFVVTDQVVGRIQNIAEAAVVLLQLDLVLHLELAHKVGHVAHACATEGVDALVVIAHSQDRATA